MDFPRESLELMKTLADADPAAQTACSEWTVHDLVAHLAAGASRWTNMAPGFAPGFFLASLPAVTVWLAV